MADSSTKTKTVSIRLPNKELGQVDAYALARGLNRSQAMLEILRKGLAGEGGGDAMTARLDAISAKLDAMDAANRLAAAGVMDAVKNQPIAVQQQALPAPEVTDADVQAYIRARRPDIELDMFGDPVEGGERRGGGLLSRLLRHG